jgi:hypothetical protein
MDDTRPPPRREPRFEQGQIVYTPGALSACSNVYLHKCLVRHLMGDWGCACPEDKATNDEAVSTRDRIMSAYPIDPAKPCEGWGDNTLWIVTEADRSVTTFLLPEEY